MPTARVIWDDLSEWNGDTTDFDQSSTSKGVLTIMVCYDNSIYKHLMMGSDHYYVEGLKIGQYNDDDKQIEVLTMNGPNKEVIEWKDISTINTDFIRDGKWAEWSTMDKAHQRILET